VGAVSCRSRRLDISVHDASPAVEEVLREIDSFLRKVGAFPYSLLVIPSLRGEWPLEDHPGFCDWLRDLSRSGVRMVLHGLHHCGGGECRGPSSAVRRLLFTRGEGEFLCMTREESARRMAEGRRILAGVLGRPVTAFVAPAWLYSRGSMAALKDMGFRYAESRWRQWDPAGGKTLLHSPVLNLAGGCAFKREAAAAWVYTGSRLLAAAGTIRMALHPEDFSDPERKRAVVDLLPELLAGREPVGGGMTGRGTGEDHEE